MTAKDLKNALLQEAVQGKLVPQIASEGNARDLLEEIRKEKAKLIKEGKIKKEKPLPEITEDEIPFEIPENWCWCRLGEIVKNVNYGTSAKSHLTGKIPVLRMGNITKDGKLSFDNLVYTSDATEIQTYKLNAGDILFNRTNSAEWVGKTAVYKGEQPAIFAGYIIRYTPIFINSDYVNAVMNTSYQKKWCSEVKTNGVQQCNINAQNLMKFIFPLPPLAEQKRIVATIEKFMPLIEEYGKKESALKAINEQIGALTKKAILQEAVQGKLVPQIAAEGNAKDLLEEIKKEKTKLIKEGKIKKEKPLPEITEDEIPFDIPENWCWCRLSELCNLYTGDSINETEKKLKYTNVKEGWFYIGTKDVNFDQTINYDNGIKIPFEKDNFRIAPKNTVLMCIEGGSAGRKIAFTNQDVCFGNKLCCFNPYKNEIEKFLFYFLQSTIFTDAFKNNINGIIGGVSINNLKGMLFPLPPLAEQKRIVAAIEKMLPLCEKLGAQKK